MSGFAAAAAAGAVVLAACLAVIAATPGDAYWINDCGNKALVAERLLETGFRQADFAQPGRALDPEGRWFPIPPPFALRRGAEFVSAYPLAFPALAAPGLAAWGARGLRLPAAFGAAAAAALLAAWLAPVLGAGGALAAGLAAGARDTALLLRRHRLGARSGARARAGGLDPALAAAAPRLVRGGSARRCRLLAARGDGVDGARGDRRRAACARAAAAVAAFAAGAAAPLAALALFNHALLRRSARRACRGEPRRRGVRRPRAVAERFSALPGLLGGFGHGAGEQRVFALLALALPLAGALAPRRVRESSWLPLALAAAGLAAWAVAGARMLAGPSRLQELVQHNGLLLQWPLLAFAGLGIDRVRRDPAWSGLRVGVTAGLLFLGLVLAAGILLPSGFGAQVGAGVHWGPRVLLPALPALVVLAAAGLVGRAPAARLAWAALALAGVASSALSVWFLAQQTADGARFAERLRGEGRARDRHAPSFLGPAAGRLWKERPMLLTLDAAALQAASLEVRRAGEPGFILIAPAGARLGSTLPGVGLRARVPAPGQLSRLLRPRRGRCAFAESGRAAARRVTLQPMKERASRRLAGDPASRADRPARVRGAATGPASTTPSCGRTRARSRREPC